MIVFLVLVVFLNQARALNIDVFSPQVDPCNKYKTIEGINYTLTTNNGSNTSCVTGCLYTRHDGKEGNICVAKPANSNKRKKQLKTIKPLKGCPVHNNITKDKKIVAAYVWQDIG